MGLKQNIVFSSILTVSGYIFPFITFPYVTRVLGVEKFGICNFYDSIITYFILFSMMGMSTLGIREIAKCKNDKEKLTNVFSSLFILNLVTTIISILILLCSVFFVDKFKEHPQMIYIGAAKVLSNFLLIEWFYRGIEEFKYITIRSILIRSIYVVSVFIFVKTQNDYILYFVLTTLMFTINAIINMIYSRQFVKFSLKSLDIKKYLVPFSVFGVYQILTSMYTSFNVAYLGFVSSNEEVGYYSSSVKLFNILLSFYTAFSGVLLPRMSYLFSNGDRQSFYKIVYLSLNLLLSLAIPIIIYAEIYTVEIIHLMSGSGFEGAVLPMKIVLPLVLIIGLEQIFVFQILMPQNKDREIFINSLVGALVGIGINLCIVHQFGSSGSAIVWVLSEFCVLIVSILFVYGTIKEIPLFKMILKRIIIFIPIILVLVALKNVLSGLILLLVAGVILTIYSLLLELYYYDNSPVKIIFLKLINRKQ